MNKKLLTVLLGIGMSIGASVVSASTYCEMNYNGCVAKGFNPAICADIRDICEMGRDSIQWRTD